MSRIEVPKATAHIGTGFPAAINVAKVTAHLLLYPGAPGEDTSRNVTVFSNVVRRPD